MQILTVQVTNQAALKALQNLEEKNYIRIVDEMEYDSAPLPGKPLSWSTFVKWINDAETEGNFSQTKAKQKWASKRKQLQKLTR